MNNHTLSKEEWEILDFNPRYAVSSMGHVMRVQSGKSTKIGRLLKPRKTYKGYLHVVLYSGTKNSSKRHSIHSLVLHAFVAPREKGLEGNHKNGIKSDNRLENLEWVTPSQNVRHAFDTLNHRVMRGDLNGHAKLTEVQVIQVRQMLASDVEGRTIARIMNVAECTISDIKHNRTWKHLK